MNNLKKGIKCCFILFEVQNKLIGVWYSRWKCIIEIFTIIKWMQSIIRLNWQYTRVFLIGFFSLVLNVPNVSLQENKIAIRKRPYERHLEKIVWVCGPRINEYGNKSEFFFLFILPAKTSVPSDIVLPKPPINMPLAATKKLTPVRARFGKESWELALVVAKQRITRASR